nr:acyl-CoA thioesterase domain-containing protein [Streptomyces sudanensis]
MPPEFVPISVSMEIRPVGTARPYAGGPDPELVAWVRLLEDDAPPDVFRFVFLMDALAPSYAAVLSELVLVPTVELTVRPGAGLAGASSPWVLLRARTLAATPGGWVDEQIDAWGPDGTHLGTAHQLRVVRAG